jgi:hypothetical protein
MRPLLALAALVLICAASLGAEARMRFQGVSPDGIADASAQPVETRTVSGITLPGAAR